MRTIRLEAVLGAFTPPPSSAVLSGTTGLGPAGWVLAIGTARYAPLVAESFGHSVVRLYRTGARTGAAAGHGGIAAAVVISRVTQLHDDDLVVVLRGDHQPATTVTRAGANSLVTVSFVAHDPAVLSRIDSWHWQDGLLPSPTAPVWPMDAFRNQFLDAFSTPPTARAPRPVR